MPLRYVGIATLLGLTWKFKYFAMGDRVYHSLRMRHDFFPAFFQDADVLRAAYIAALLSVLVTIMVSADRTRTRIVASLIGMTTTTILILHQGTYNDMTFLTAWWAMLWMLWYGSRIGLDTPDLLIGKAAKLSRVIVSILFLGGAVGKWTSEYWSGQILYEIYFVDRDFWFFNLLRSWFQGEDLRTFATWYSRMVILTESAGGLTFAAAFWLRSRTVAVLAAATLAGIALMSNFLLVSVLAPVIGLALVGCFDSPLARPASSGSLDPMVD